MRALVLCGDDYHPAETIRSGLAPLEGDEFAFSFSHSTTQMSRAFFEHQMIVLAGSGAATARNPAGRWTQDMQGALLDYVQRGGGLVAVHAGTAGILDLPRLRGLLGGAFVRHPPRCAVRVVPVMGEPIAAGVAPFAVEDEHYHMAWDDPGVRMFCWTRSAHGIQPGGWTRREGQGRVAVLTPGHTIEVWRHPSFQALLRGALRWCAPPT